MNRINLLFTMNQNYVMPCLVALTSIFENDKDSKFRVYMLHSGITDFEKIKIFDLAQKYNQEINEIKVDDKYFGNADFKRWSKETYYRLLTNEYIPHNLDRILYLDCDIVVIDTLKKFYNLDFEDKYLATPIWEECLKEGKRLNFSPENLYFPAGFLLYNLKKINTLFNYENLKKEIIENQDILKFADMDLLNILLKGKIKPIYKDFYYIGEDKDFKEKNPPSIIHFSSSKPWHNIIRGRYDDIWLQYLKLSPYSYLYNEKYNNLKTKILRSGIGKFLIRNLFSSKFYMFLDKILPKVFHDRIRKIYRKYFK